ncbi:MAG TPA: DUF1579 domain-containing protein [Gemmatimonadota bacterium]|nr:DUF1579 domain-containing protein [Gemmatimonadota bacterium]
MKKSRIVAIVAIAGAGLAFAQGARAQEMTPEMMETWARFSNPGEHHQIFNEMAGSWTHKVTMWMAPGAPPMESTATSTSELSMDGRWLEDTFSGTMWGMPFEGHNLLGYDNFREEYVSIWRDNLSTAPMISRGTYDPATKTLTMTATVDDFMSGARDVPVRQVITSPDATHSTMEMYMPGPDGNEFLSMRIESTKTP